MIGLSDVTLREADGEYKRVCKLMPSGTWMLRSDIFVDTELMATTFTIHCWDDGSVVIHDLNRPVRMEVPDDDVRLLSEWCRIHGWKELKIHDRLIADKGGFDYWQRSFRAGIVISEELQEYEDAEIERLSKAYAKEQKEEEQCH